MALTNIHTDSHILILPWCEETQTHTQSCIPHSYSSAYFSIIHCMLHCTIIITLKLFYDALTKPNKTLQSACTHTNVSIEAYAVNAQTARMLNIRGWLEFYTSVHESTHSSKFSANIKAYCNRKAASGNHYYTHNLLKRIHTHLQPLSSLL